MDPRIERLLDRQEIAALIHAYCAAVDARDYSEVASLFLPECRVDYGRAFGKVLERASELPERLAQALAGFPVTSHHVSNVQIEFEDDDRARVATSLLAWHQLPDRGDLTVIGHYHDTVARTPQGWRFAERRLEYKDARLRGPGKTLDLG